MRMTMTPPRPLASTAEAAKNLLLVDELQAILRSSHQSGLGCVPLRGVALGEWLYGNPVARPTGDIDLLVRREELDGMRTVLSALGFREVEPRPGAAVRYDYTLAFFKWHHLLVIAEPHWSLAYQPFLDRLDMAAVWRRCQPAHVLGIPSYQLATEDLLLHLSLHYLHHRPGAPSFWLDEMDGLIRRDTLQWSLLLATAREARLGLLVATALQAVRTHCHTPIPEEVMHALSNGALPSSEARLTRFLATSVMRGRERIATLLILPGWGAKLQYLLSYLFPSTAFIRLQYGVAGWRTGWIYLWRLASLSVAGLRGLWQVARHRCRR